MGIIVLINNLLIEICRMLLMSISIIEGGIKIFNVFEVVIVLIVNLGLYFLCSIIGRVKVLSIIIDVLMIFVLVVMMMFSNVMEMVSLLCLCFKVCLSE